MKLLLICVLACSTALAAGTSKHPQKTQKSHKGKHAIIRRGPAPATSNETVPKTPQKATPPKDYIVLHEPAVPQKIKDKVFEDAGIRKADRRKYILAYKVPPDSGGTKDILNLQVITREAAREKVMEEMKRAAENRQKLKAKDSVTVNTF